MSTVYIIKDGIIIDSVIAYSSHRDSRGETYKPRTAQEERELLQFSENNKRMNALKSELEELKKEADFSGIGMEYAVRVERMFDSFAELEHQKFCPGELRFIREQWDEAQRVMFSMGADEAAIAQAIRTLEECASLKRKVLEAKLHWAADYNRALEKLKTLRANAGQLEELMFYVETTEGTEALDAEVDARTKGALTGICRELEEISGSLAGGNEPDNLEELLKRLEEIDGRLTKLPESAEEVFTAQLWREEQARNVAERLENAGWLIKEVSSDGGIFDDIYLLTENIQGNKAAVIFTIDGETRIESFFGENETLHGLQKTVLDALINGGAKKATGHCMKGSTPQTVQEQRTDSVNQEQVKTPGVAAAQMEGEKK